MLKVYKIRDAIKIYNQMLAGPVRIGRLFSRLTLITAFLPVFILTSVQLCPAAETSLEVKPRWARPGAEITVILGRDVDISKKIFLRLTGDAAVKDLPLDSEQARRSVIQTMVPDPMRADIYETSLVNEENRTLVPHGPKIKIAISERPEEKPVITKVVPRASYPENRTYDFNLIGENYGKDPERIDIMINDIIVNFKNRIQVRGNEQNRELCAKKLPCLINSRRHLSVYGFSVNGQSIKRPLRVSVVVDGIMSDEKELMLSSVDRSIPIVIAFSVLGILVIVVYLISKRKAAKYKVSGRSYTVLRYLLIEPETNTYSLSHLQLSLWTAAAIVAYVYLTVSQFLVQSKWALPSIPEGFPLLLGMSAGTSVLAVGATELRGSKGAGPVHPELGDFITSGGVFAPERLQFFLWTLIGVFGFLTATLAQDPATLAEPPKIPENFLPLMGLSSLGYLAGKVAHKPGPIIKQLALTPPDATPVTSIRVVGENLSPRAQVMLNGEMLETIHVGPATIPPAGTEFVTELIIKQVPALPTAPEGKLSVKVINPDGQSAEIYDQQSSSLS